MIIEIDIPDEMKSYIDKNKFDVISEIAYGSMAMLAIKNGIPVSQNMFRKASKKCGEKSLACMYCKYYKHDK